MLGRTGLVGDTGFVGGTLMRQLTFDRTYNSRSIDKIVGERFDTVICAGAPATMWAANANPQADLDNLRRLTAMLDQARIGRLILISTIAVFDNAAAGYTEHTGRYETGRAYGRHRRELELHALDRHKAVVVRLPALFGAGLKKNFIFDVMNPIPSFIKPGRFADARAAMTTDEARAVDEVYSLDAALDMHKLDRTALDRSGSRPQLEQAFERIGFSARDFTNSTSTFQYYNLANLGDDIATAVDQNLTTLNICVEPWSAGELHAALIGTPFVNAGPPAVHEDMRTDYASAFGRTGPYLQDRAEVLRDLKAFVAQERT